jgi:FKBP-type peptidyl-prolyl cis-trans isomerase
MQLPFSSAVRRVLTFVFLGAASLSTVACGDDAPVAPITPSKDYAPIDEAIIKKYLDDNGITTAQRQASGLYYVPIITNPNAVRATAHKMVDVLYTGRFMDGRVFDSAQDPSKPFTFVLGKASVIPGWDEGIALMHKGDKGELLIPSALAYGGLGAGSTIPPNTVLRFEVQLLDVR